MLKYIVTSATESNGTKYTNKQTNKQTKHINRLPGF
jgi:hypothetical protein